MTRYAPLAFRWLLLVVVTWLIACQSQREGDINPVPDDTAVSPTGAAVATNPDPVMIFDISGGVGDFCDTLRVDVSGHYDLQSCAIPASSGILEPADLDSLQSWLNNLAPFQAQTNDTENELTMTLLFNGQGQVEADEAQLAVMLEWANSLFIRLRPQPATPPPTPTSPVVSSDGLCPEVARPAPLIANFDTPNALTLIDPTNQATCDFPLDHPPFGRIVVAGGNLYYPVFEPDAQTVTIWQVNPTGQATPLAFTTISMADPGPYNFTLSTDGGRIAWTQTTVTPDIDPARTISNLWVANIDGSDLVKLLDQVETTGGTFVEPIQFAADQSALYYALQPLNIGGSIFEISGRYHSLYSLPLAGGPGRMIHTCSAQANPLCIGDVDPTGERFVYVEAGQVTLATIQGDPVARLTPPTTDYIGQALFGPTGQLAFVSATLAPPATDNAPPLPNPGYLSLIEPPYDGQARTLLTDNSLATLWDWLDGTRLMVGSIDEAGNVGTALVTTDGQLLKLSPNYALAVLR